MGAIPIATIFRQLPLVFCVINKALEYGYRTDIWYKIKSRLSRHAHKSIFLCIDPDIINKLAETEPYCRVGREGAPQT